MGKFLILKETEFKRKRETLPYWMGGLDPDEAQYRPLTARPLRDLTPLVQDRMLKISHFLFDSNPIAKRIIELAKNFILGEGVFYTAKNERVKKILDEFWHDPINNLELKLGEKVSEL